jgi:hypothetical protein
MNYYIHWIQLGFWTRNTLYSIAWNSFTYKDALYSGKSLSTICQLYFGSYGYSRGNGSTWRKSLTCHKSLTNFITQSYCCIEYTTSCVGFTRKTFYHMTIWENEKKIQEIWLAGIFLWKVTIYTITLTVYIYIYIYIYIYLYIYIIFYSAWTSENKLIIKHVWIIIFIGYS